MVLLSDTLLSYLNIIKFERNEKKIVDNSVDSIKNADQQIIYLREQLSNFFVDILIAPGEVYKKLNIEKEKLKTTLLEFHGIYDELIETNVNAISTQTDCEKSLDSMKAEEAALKTLLQKAQEKLEEKERDLEAATEKHETNVKMAKEYKDMTLCGTTTLIICAIVIVHFAICRYFDKPIIPVWSIILIIPICCVPCALPSSIFFLCIGICYGREDKNKMKKTQKLLKKENVETEKKKSDFSRITANLENITAIHKNQTDKIRVFGELKNILCNVQIYLRKFQTSLNEIENRFEAQNCSPQHLLKLAECERQIFAKDIIKIFNEVQSIYNQYESMKLQYKSLL